MSTNRSLEIWGGIECTIARMGGTYRNQVDETGHRGRPDDLDHVASLGIRTLRYPVLWEDVSPDRPDRAKWRWHDRRLGRLRELGIDPIVGLLHHGSGPRYTSLVDPDFPAKLARHAEAVARRYPWVSRYIPVNEPLTTARFSCLYGHWYPHRASYRDVLLALVHQCRGVIEAMAAIRRVNPEARLIQTEDCGRIFSTPRLAYQAEHENERRWLTFDLLLGRVTRHHPWWRICRDHGVPERDLCLLRDAEIRPDLIGINHYLTSDRFLDENPHLYPAHLAGGNGREAYADVEAVRVELPQVELGPAPRLRETWERYRVPIAVTEAHHGCTRDEQIRWLMEVWQAAHALRREGADIRAVTAWSLFGSVDWNSLLTREAGIYEPGAFDIRGPEPRPTALASAVRSLAASGTFDHPILDGPSWWRRPARLHVRGPAAPFPALKARRRLLIRGPIGPPERALMRAAEARGLAILGEGQRTIPFRTLLNALARGEIWGVLDRLDANRGERASAERRRLLAAAARAGAGYVMLSTGQVFDGSLGRAALEGDEPVPTDEAARLILAEECAVLAAGGHGAVVRTGSPFGPEDGEAALGSLLEGPPDPSSGKSTQMSLTYLPDLAHVILDGLTDGDGGLRHLVSGTMPRAMLLQRLAAGPRLVAVRSTLVEVGQTARPWAGVIATERGELMPPLDRALDRYLADRPEAVFGEQESRPLAAA